MKYIKCALFAYLSLLSENIYARGRLTEKQAEALILFFISGIFFFLLFLLAHRYNQVKNKKLFWRSSFMQAIIWPVSIFLLTIVVVNILAPSAKEKTLDTISSDYEIHQQLLRKEEEAKKLAEENPTYIDKNYEYIFLHYSNSPLLENDYNIINYYLDRTIADDLEFRNIGFFGAAYCFYYRNNPDTCLSYLTKCTNQKLKYLNYVKGLASLRKNDTANAIASMQKEEYLYGIANKENVLVLGDVYLAQKEYKKVYDLLNKYRLENDYSTSTLRRIYILNNDVINYTYTVFKDLFSYVSIKIVITSLLISLAWLFYIYKLDIFEKEKHSYIAIVFLYSCLCCLFAHPLYDIFKFHFHFSRSGEPLNDLLYCIFGIGAIEEFVKIIPLLIILLFTKEINEPFDYLFYACTSALGFAFMENIMYLNYDSTHIIYGRAFYASIGHMCDSAFFAYGLVLAKYRYKNFNSILAFFLFYLVACISHGLYDFIVFQHTGILFIFFFYIEIAFFALIVNNSLNNSTFFTYSNNPRSHRLEFMLSMSFTLFFLMEYVVNAFQKGVQVANHELYTTYIISWLVVPFFIYKLSRLDLVKNHWFGYYNKVKNKHGQDSTGSQIVAMFFGDSIEPHNYVGVVVSIQAGRQNERLRQFLPGAINATITDRWVVSIKPKGKKYIYKDPYWFVLSLHEPMYLPEGETRQLLCRLKYNSPNLLLYPNLETSAFLLPANLSGEDKDKPEFYHSLLYKGIIKLTSSNSATK